MAIFQINNCPVCGGNEFNSFLECTDFFVSGEKFKIKECANCGLKITSNAKDEKEINRYYQSEVYVSHSNTSKGVVNTVYHFVRKIMLMKKRRFVEKITNLKTGTIMDIGTGTGFFLNEMKKSGWRVFGTEKSEQAREFANSKFGVNIVPPENIFLMNEGKYEVITLWHVLEHIHTINKNIERLVKLLKADGKLVIAIPNFDSYDARHYKKYWAAWDVPRHIWHFSPKQFKIMAEKHGLKVNMVKSMPFDPFYISMLSEKYKKTRLGFLKGAFWGLISWMNSCVNSKKGSSIVYVCTKNTK